MDPMEEQLTEELEFWRCQIHSARQRGDLEVLPRLTDALKLVEFKIRRLRRRNLGKLPI